MDPKPVQPWGPFRKFLFTRLFYVNELPRLSFSNPLVKFETIQDDKLNCQLIITSKGTEETITFEDCPKPGLIYEKLMEKLKIN